LPTRPHFERLLLAAVICLATLAGAAQAAGVAYVNGKEITEADFILQMREAAGHDVLMAMIETRIITDAFVQSGLPLLDADVTAFLAQRFGSRENFETLATQNGIDPAAYIERAIKPQLMLERLALNAAPASPENLQKYFEANRAKYGTPETLTLRQIVVGTQEDADKVMAALKEGADFAQVAKDNSMEPSAQQSGGLIENVPATSVPPPLDQAIKELQEGAHTTPLAIGQMFVILKLEKRTPAKEQTFEEAQAQVETDYRAEQTGREALTALREKLRREARVHVQDKEFKGIEEELKCPLTPPSGPGGY
jgi:foldase protein PrsA